MMLETLLTLVLAFVGTNLDDLFINTLFFAQVESRAGLRAVTAGKYLGMGLLVGAAVLGGYCLQAVPQRFIGLLGVVPVGLGVKEWLAARRNDPDGADPDAVPSPAGGLLWNTALVTVSNGADNLGVYLPLFAGYGAAQLAAAVAVFAVMTGLWCRLGRALADLPGLRGLLLRHKGTLVPLVYLALGGYILLKAL